MVNVMIVMSLFSGLAFVWLRLFKDTNEQGLQDLILLQFSRGEACTHHEIRTRLINYSQGEISLGPDTVLEYLDVLEKEGSLQVESTSQLALQKSGNKYPRYLLP